MENPNTRGTSDAHYDPLLAKTLLIRILKLCGGRRCSKECGCYIKGGCILRDKVDSDNIEALQEAVQLLSKKPEDPEQREEEQ